jgi:integrase/recombinase XerD
MTTSTLTLSVSGGQDLASWAAVAFVASYSSPGTRQAYATQLRLWFDWCEQHHLEPLADVRRPHVELYARDLEARGLAAATVALKLVVLTGFYRYCVEEQLLEHSPAVHVRRPKISQESTRLGLERTELGAFLVHAGLSGGNDHALACLLALNALRVSEACGADLSDLALANGHRVVRIVGKGNQPALIPLAPRTGRAIDAAVGERTEGPLLARADGSRLDRHAAGRIVRRLATRAGIDKPISPHSLRHAAITAALDAGCSLRDVQDFARHADPRQTRRYDRARGALDRNPTYIVATYLAGATGAR